ncbi:MAG: hypothetical protein Q9160_004066 [Pyrenula sp. 1 TL-2023]
MPPSDIVLVPGFWEGPFIWRDVASALQERNFTVTTVSLPSTGTPASSSNPKSPSMYDDIEAIRQVVASVVEGDGHGGKDALVVAHSAGAFLASHALEELTPAARKRACKSGAVVKLVFVAGAIFPVEHVHRSAPFFDIRGDKLFCTSPRSFLFNDIIDDAQAQAEVEKLTFQPGFGWDAKIEYAAWTEIPSAYLMCLKDNAIPVALQRALAYTARCDPVGECEAGHCAPITKPKDVAEFVIRVVEGTRSA